MTELVEALRAAQADLDAIVSDLAHVQEKLAGPRMARRAVRDRVAEACVNFCPNSETIARWRPPNAEEVARIDRVHRETADIIAEFTPIERTLKEARRVANVKVEQVKKAMKTSRPNRGKTGGRTGEAFSPVDTDCLK